MHVHKCYFLCDFGVSCVGGKESKGWEKVGRECKTWEGGIEKRTPRIVSRKETKTSRDKENWTENVKN